MAIPTQDFLETFKSMFQGMIEAEVTRQMEARAQEKEENDIINVKEVARLTGFKENTIYQMSHLKQIPCFRVRKSLRFSKKAVMAWLVEGNHKPYNKTKA